MNFVHRGAYFPETAPPTAEAAQPPPSTVETRGEATEGPSAPLPPAESTEREDLKRASR
jgi:hypothetical protein